MTTPKEFLKQDKYISIKDAGRHSFCNEIDIKKYNQEFIERKLIELKDYFDNMYEDIILDKEQRIAILTDEDYNMVIAGAGSGKTTTMAAKVKYLVEKLHIEPKDIILISYTNKAVDELREKLEKFEINSPVYTFHKFGIDVLKQATDENLKVLINGYNIISDYFDRVLCNDNKRLKEFLKFFIYYFDIPMFALKFDSLNSYHNYKKRNNYITLKSRLGEVTENLKSNEEVMIANFLYLNNIEYDYEKPYNNTYTTDFTIYQGDKTLFLEHYPNIYQGSSKLKNKMTNYLYQKNINRKRKLHKRDKTVLLETYSGSDLLDNLKEQLINNGIVLNPKNKKEIYNSLVDTSKDIYYSRFIIFCLNFIQSFKIKGLENFEELKKDADDRTLMFLNFIEVVYTYYEKELKTNNLIDFEDMINRAYFELDKKDIKLNYKYIIIDEYQDISMQRFNLTKKIADVSGAKIIVVGDDWQAVFAFAGSDITLFTEFKKLMGYAEELQITHTYRNSQELIDIAGGFIMKNDFQIKKKLISPKKISKPVVLVIYDDEKDKINNKTIMLEKCLKDIFDNYGDNQRILLIGRFNFEKNHLLQSKLFNEKESKKMESINYPNFDIDFLSAHSSKGLGYDQVIILNGSDDTYGFPSQIKDDPIMDLVKSRDNSILFSEERRLFYVALTRTKNKVYILVPNNNPSEFILEIKKYNGVSLFNKLGFSLSKKNCPKCKMPLVRKYNNLKITNLYICSNEKELCDFKTNNLKYLRNINKCPLCRDGKLIIKYSKNNNSYFKGCTNYKGGCLYIEKA